MSEKLLTMKIKLTDEKTYTSTIIIIITGKHKKMTKKTQIFRKNSKERDI